MINAEFPGGVAATFTRCRGMFMYFLQCSMLSPADIPARLAGALSIHLGESGASDVEDSLLSASRAEHIYKARE